MQQVMQHHQVCKYQHGGCRATIHCLYVRQKTQSESNLMINSCCMSEIWNAHLHALHDLLSCNPCHDDAYFHQKSCKNCNPCHINEDVCLRDDCVDNHHDDFRHIACNHDVCGHDNALVNFNEHHGMCASCDLVLSQTELSCD